MEPTEEDIQGDQGDIQGDIQEDSREDIVEEPTQEAPQVVEEPPKKKVPKKYEKAACQKCDKVMSVNTLRYKHVCEEVPKAPPQVKAKAKPRALPPPEPKPRRQAVEPDSPRTHLRNLYTEVRVQQLEAKRDRYRGFFD